ncbi:hypothetical protein MKEN_01468100 [Mycena kentingensis (nom. inval.)]|nr:hypothetical protein MKEN_01468100 [Mycena kentingensis (nom. inval.)]
MHLSPDLCSQLLLRQATRLEQKLLNALDGRQESADPATEARVREYLRLAFLTEQSASRLRVLIENAGHTQQTLRENFENFATARKSAQADMRKWEQLRADYELAADTTCLSGETTGGFRARVQFATKEYDAAVVTHDRALQDQLQSLLLGSQILEQTEKHARLEEDAVELWMYASSRALNLIEGRNCDCALWAFEDDERERIARELDSLDDGVTLDFAGMLPPQSPKKKTLQRDTSTTNFRAPCLVPSVSASSFLNMRSTERPLPERLGILTGSSRARRPLDAGVTLRGRRRARRELDRITKLERREATLHKIAAQVRVAPGGGGATSTTAAPRIAGAKRKAEADIGGRRKMRKKATKLTLDFAESEALPYKPPEFHSHVSSSRNHPLNISAWLSENEGDPALKNFQRNLKNHLLTRVLHPEYSSDGSEYTATNRNNIFIVNNRLYRHKVLRINYTSYDIRREQDSMDSRHADVMMLAPEDSDDEHPFSYARIIGIFHCDVQHRVHGYLSAAAPVTLLWIRRFRLDKTWKGGFKRRRLHRVEFVPDSDDSAYGFINPDEIIREAHLVPAFAHGSTEWQPDMDSVGRPGEHDDWRFHYVNFFVDRDMIMRYLGGGVGHSYQIVVPDPEPDEANYQEEESDEEDQPQPDIGSRESAEDDHEGSDSDTEDDGDEGEESGDEGEEECLGPEDGEDVRDRVDATL